MDEEPVRHALAIQFRNYETFDNSTRQVLSPRSMTLPLLLVDLHQEAFNAI